MRILQVYKTPYPKLAGGVDVVVANLLHNPTPGNEMLLLRAAPWTTPRVEATSHEGIHVRNMHFPLPPTSGSRLAGWLGFFLRAPATILRLRRLLEDLAIDVIHLHTLQNYHLYFALLRMCGGPPFIVTLHRAEVLAYPERGLATRWIWRSVLRHAAKVTAVSNWLTARARQTFPCSDGMLCVPNGIDLDVLPTDAAELLQRFGIAPGYFAMVGTFQRYKGHETALEALAQLAPKFSNLSIVLVGGGELEGDYRSMIARLGIEHRVHFTGPLNRADVLGIVAGSEALIMPSRNEGFGLAVVEAGLVNVVPVCSDIGPFTEIVRHDDTGLLFPVGDSTLLARALERITSDASLRRRLADAFAVDVRTRHAARHMAAGYAKLYADCAHRH